MKTSLFIGVLSMTLMSCVAASSSESAQTKGLTALSDSDLREVTIAMERTGCYGNYPSYVVTRQGTIKFETLKN